MYCNIQGSRTILMKHMPPNATSFPCMTDFSICHQYGPHMKISWLLELWWWLMEKHIVQERKHASLFPSIQKKVYVAESTACTRRTCMCLYCIHTYLLSLIARQQYVHKHLSVLAFLPCMINFYIDHHRGPHTKSTWLWTVMVVDIEIHNARKIRSCTFPFTREKSPTLHCR